MQTHTTKTHGTKFFFNNSEQEHLFYSLFFRHKPQKRIADNNLRNAFGVKEKQQNEIFYEQILKRDIYFTFFFIPSQSKTKCPILLDYV